MFLTFSCSKREALYACQNRVLDKCDGAKRLQELGGNEQNSMQAGMDVLCKDVDGKLVLEFL